MKRQFFLGAVNLLCKLHILSPIQVAKLKYYYKFHRLPDFQNPKDLNEKINWMKFYGDTSQWADLADKYKVREYIASKGLEDILVKLYGKWNNANDIDWDSLPNEFVLKVNNGCGDVLICRDKNNLDKAKVIGKYNSLVSMKYGDVTGEPHYAEIKPCIIAEELLDISKQAITSSSLIDYKVWCLNGKPYLTWCAWNRRGACGADCGVYDYDWNYRPEYSIFNEHYCESKTRIPKPSNLNKLYEVASKLSEGFPILRVDLYEVDGNIYFGELTFTSLGGFMDYFTPEILLEMGNKVKLK